MPRGQYKRRKRATTASTGETTVLATTPRGKERLIADALAAQPVAHTEVMFNIIPGNHNIALGVTDPLTVLTPGEALKLSARIQSIALEAIRRG